MKTKNTKEEWLSYFDAQIYRFGQAVCKHLVDDKEAAENLRKYNNLRSILENAIELKLTDQQITKLFKNILLD